MQFLENVMREIGLSEPGQEEINAAELVLWKNTLDDADARGLYQENGQWMFDLRYRSGSKAREFYGSRVCDLAISGPDCIPVPRWVCDALGLSESATSAFQAGRD